MTTDTRVRISLSAGEFEVEGPEAFVAQYDEVVQQMLARLSRSDLHDFKSTNAATADVNVAPSQSSPAPTGDGALPEFGEAVHRLPRGTTGTDQILVAGFYAATKSAERTFATGEANKLLIEQGIRLSNPSQSLKNNISAKRVFKTGSRFKISREGIERVNDLLDL